MSCVHVKNMQVIMQIILGKKIKEKEKVNRKKEI